jgi:hypothetical protein
MDYMNELAKIADEYRSEGYGVTVHPAGTDLPTFAVNIQADLLATRPDGNAIVRVVRDRAELETYPDLPSQAELVNQQPNWRYDLVVLGPDNPLYRAKRRAGEPTHEQIQRMFTESQQLIPVSTQAALVLAWGGLEAVLRRLSQQQCNGNGTRNRWESNLLIRELVATDILSHDDFQMLDKANTLRTEIIHGLAPPNVTGDTVEAIIHRARQLLQESDNVQAVAG